MAVSTSVPPPRDIDRLSISAAPAIELSPLSPSPFSKALEPLTPLPVSAPIPLKYNLFVPGIKNAVNAIQKGSNGKKRQVEDDQPVEAKLVDNSTSWSQKSVLKRKRVMSADEDNETTNPVLMQVVLSQYITEEDLASACLHHLEGTDDRGFWDAESRPVEWGQDSAIATAVKCNIEHSHNHSRNHISSHCPAIHTLSSPFPAILHRPGSHRKAGGGTKTIITLTSTQESILHGPGYCRQASSGTKTIFPPMSAQEPATSQLSNTSTLEIPPPALFEASNSKKRKADDEDTDGADVIEASKLASTSQELMKKKRKLNQNVDNRPTGIINVKPKILLTVTTDKVVLPGNEKAFWDTDTWPAEWGSDAHIATPCQMKITCAINGVSVRQRMQVKAAMAIVEEEKQQPGPLAGVPMCTLLTAPANITNSKPTARDILQGIQDLSKRLDLFATNDCVDALEIRVHSVENILHQQLNALEQCLNASDAW
ncbi:hypothetical protein BDR06DRAFT_1008194 [Suillus hirtellus]|nr:hypothetical protein BDR06DRAFT_1008194 [Suillus hirtellus]